jgi:hypothetical protein
MLPRPLFPNIRANTHRGCLGQDIQLREYNHLEGDLLWETGGVGWEEGGILIHCLNAMKPDAINDWGERW